MISSKNLLPELQQLVNRLEDDLRRRCESLAEVDAPVRAAYEAARVGNRTSKTYGAWRDEELTQVAVAWVLACVFIRFLEDNELIEVPLLAGPEGRLQRAKDEHELFFRAQPTATEREYYERVFGEVGGLPAMKEFFDRRHNPLWKVAPSGDAARELLEFWRRTNPETGRILHDFTDPAWGTRFLGDLYQDLSEAAKKNFALLQTPEFVESFILDRTLTPAIQTFGYQAVRMIDPTCGSGHFVLGGFDRLFRLWQEHNPGENPRVLAQKALDGVFGVDLNPYAVAIARFRLLLAALRACGIRRLKGAPEFQVHLAVGDSLLHGARFDDQGKPYFTARQTMFEGETEEFRDELRHHYEVEDVAALHRILGQQYHAVVGNPPYITVKDRAIGDLYRARFLSCHRQYSLSVPFMERFFDLAVKGDGTPQQPAGFVGQITSNSFMKREFGKKLVEEFLPRWDLTHVIDTSGAYIPGHGTPTVILFGKNQPPVTSTVRAVLGIRNEPTTPSEPELGIVWQAICRQIDNLGSESEWISVADSARGNFHRHPWSIGGGGASELKLLIDESGECQLGELVTAISSICLTRLDDVYVLSSEILCRQNIPSRFQIGFIIGECVRDWAAEPTGALFPYDNKLHPVAAEEGLPVLKILWPHRENLWRRRELGGDHRELDRTWWEWNRFLTHRFNCGKAISFSNVATHNHFVLDSGQHVFNSHAPIIKLGSEASDEEYLRLLRVLNSSTVCFWLQQVCHNKGRPGAEIAGADEPYEQRFEFDNTKLATLPIPKHLPVQLPPTLVQTSTAMQVQSPAATLASWGGPESGDLRPWLARARDLATRQRRQLIAWQEELDWQVYAAYGLISERDNLLWPEDRMDELPPLELGERTFEIFMARQMGRGTLQTTWFERHAAAGSRPITAPPQHWRRDYLDLYHRRHMAIQKNPSLRLIEQPEYKRRWNTESWDDQLKRALQQWMLVRLECYFHDSDRMRPEIGPPLPDALQSFTAAARPHLVSTNQLAELVQTDRAFLEVGEIYTGSSGFSVPKLVRDLVEAEAVPNLPVHRYKEPGLRKRRDWEHVWDLQREEDRIDAAILGLKERIKARVSERLNIDHADLVVGESAALAELERLDRAYHDRFHAGTAYDPKTPHYCKAGVRSDPDQLAAHAELTEALRKHESAAAKLKAAARQIKASDHIVRELTAELQALPAKPEVPVPPKYASADFKKAAFWKLRGKLDVPKERWVMFPGAERDGDPSPLVAWAGWNPLQQAQALAEYYLDAKQTQGWGSEKLQLLLAGILDLLPWLKQWHNDTDPDLGMGLGDYFEGFVEAECRGLGATVEDLLRLRFGNFAGPPG